MITGANHNESMQGGRTAGQLLYMCHLTSCAAAACVRSSRSLSATLSRRFSSVRSKPAAALLTVRPHALLLLLLLLSW